MKVGLLLEGGAMRGMYTAGVIDVFLDKNIKIDGIVGVSAGVLFGINYISKQRGRVLNYNLKFINDPRYMGIKSLIKTGNIINKDFAYYEIPLKLDIFDEKTFLKSKCALYATVTNVETGKAEYLKITKPVEEMEAMRATSAMPFVSQIVEYNGKKYLDGGIADSLPIGECQKLGYDKIIVVLTRPLDYRKKKIKGARFISKLKYGKYPDLIDAIDKRYQNYNDSIDKITALEKSGDIFVIRPSKTIKLKRLEKDKEKLKAMYDLGVHDCKQLIGDLKKYLND